MDVCLQKLILVPFPLFYVSLLIRGKKAANFFKVLFFLDIFFLKYIQNKRLGKLQYLQRWQHDLHADHFGYAVFTFPCSEVDEAQRLISLPL